MTHWKVLVNNSETLTAADLGEHAPTVVIESVEGVIFEGEKEDKETGQTHKTTDKKALLSFRGREKKLAANFINCTLLAAMFGDEYEDWVGHKVTLFATTVELKGALYGKPCIRIKGSPEIAGPIRVEMKMPRRKTPVVRTLQNTASAQGESRNTPRRENDPSTSQDGAS